MVNFSYYYDKAAEQYSFYRIPKYLLIGDEYAGLSLQAKLLYGMILDRMDLSLRNKWIDDNNRVYVIYQISEIMESMNVSKKKAIQYLNELETCGLVTKRNRGLGLPSLLYPMNLMSIQTA